MENIEEAIVREDGSVKIRCYYGKTVVIPADIMEKYAIGLWESVQHRMKYATAKQKRNKGITKKNGRV